METFVVTLLHIYHQFCGRNFDRATRATLCVSWNVVLTQSVARVSLRQLNLVSMGEGMSISNVIRSLQRALHQYRSFASRSFEESFLLRSLFVGVRNIVISVSVWLCVCVSACLSVCLSARIFQKHTSKFRKFSVSLRVICGRRLVLLWRQCKTLCTSGFVDDVMFSRNGANGPESNATHMFRAVRRVTDERTDRHRATAYTAL